MPVILQGGKVFQGYQSIDGNLPKIWSNGKAARFAIDTSSFNNTAYWDWSALHFQGSPSSFVFIPDPNDGGLQGDYSIGTGSTTSKYPNAVNTYDLTPILYEIEPAGGTGNFSIISRDLSYWHKYSPILISYQYTTPDNDMEFNECEWKFTDITNRDGQIIDNVRVPSNYYSKGSTYIKETTLYTLKSDNIGGINSNPYLPSKSSNADLTINFKIGPNNTSESTYCDIAMIGFINETQLKPEYFADSSTFGTYILSNPRNVPFTKLDQSIRRTLDKKVPQPMIKLLRIWQKPNILFYVHLKFIRPNFTDWNNPPAASDVVSSDSISWNTKTHYIILYIEFGISPDGGKTVWWNGYESTSAAGETGKKLIQKGIISVVPSNINEYLEATLSNYSVKPDSNFVNDSNISRYNISTKTNGVEVKGTNAFKYVRIPIWTDTYNDEANNLPKDRWQKYSCINFEDLMTNTTATNSDDTGINSEKKRNGKYWAKYPKGSQSAVKFNIGRKYKTNSWKTDIYIKLFYLNGSMKYIGATDGKEVTSKK